MIRLVGGFVGGFANALVSSAGRTAVDMLENAGRGAILSAVGGGLPGQLVSGVFQYLDRMDSRIQSQARREIRLEEKENRALQAQYRLEHQIWLEQNRWRFDWRSQPRQPAGIPEGGEWMPGRLNYPIGVKSVVSRKQRRQRNRAIKAYRARQKALGATRVRAPISSSFNYGSFL